MHGLFVRTALIILFLGAGAVLAQPLPPVPPGSAVQRPGQVKPAPRAPVKSAPLVQAKPGVAGQKPPVKAKPVVPAVVPVAPPAPAVVEPDKGVEPTKGSNTGNPLPRFATLRSDEVNLRTGPGTRYPIEWVYKRRDLPVMIEREFEVWRLIRDQEGVKGWVHQATLAPRRTGVVVGAEHVLRHDPKDDAVAVARLKAGVIVRLRSCEASADWCQTQVQDYRGWMKRSDLWGVMPGEAIQ